MRRECQTTGPGRSACLPVNNAVGGALLPSMFPPIFPGGGTERSADAKWERQVDVHVVTQSEGHVRNGALDGESRLRGAEHLLDGYTGGSLEQGCLPLGETDHSHFRHDEIDRPHGCQWQR